MAIQKMYLDPDAQSYTDDEIIGKINSGAVQITRSGCVATGARPIGSGEIVAAHLVSGVVSATKLAAGVTKTNLDAMVDLDRGYIKTDPSSGQYKVISVQRDGDGKFEADYSDVAE